MSTLRTLFLATLLLLLPSATLAAPAPVFPTTITPPSKKTVAKPIPIPPELLKNAASSQTAATSTESATTPVSNRTTLLIGVGILVLAGLGWFLMKRKEDSFQS